MMGRCLALVLAAALSGPAGAEDSALDKFTTREDALGWEAVGRVDIGNGSFCTGALIAPDLVLTAAHCVFDSRRDFAPVDANGIVFRAGFRGGEAVATRSVAAFVAHPSYVPAPVPSPTSVRNDLALLRLDAPIPAAEAAPFPVATLPEQAASVAVVSFAAGRADAPSIQRSCRVIGREPGLFAFSCDVDFGSSGAPVFDMSGARGRIVSIVSAGSDEGAARMAFGMELPGRIDEVTRALRNGEGVHTAARTEPTTSALPRSGSARVAAGGARFVKPPKP